LYATTNLRRLNQFDYNLPILTDLQGLMNTRLVVGRFWFGWCALWLCCLAAAQAPDPQSALRFQRLMEVSEAAKKYTSALMSVAQDPTGFMWFGGENGLARFDGVQFKRYEPSPEPGGPPSNVVRALLVDKAGVLWVATDRGLCRYLAEYDRFEVFRTVPDDPHSLAHNVVTSLAVDHQNRLVLGTGSGISLLDESRTRFENLPLTAGAEAVTFVLKTFVDSKNRIWVGTREFGLFLLSADGQVVRHYTASPGVSDALQSDVVKAIEEDQFGRIWVGTYGGGLSRLNEGERNFTNYLADPLDPGAIGSNTIWDIYKDSADDLWISTDQGGLARYQIEQDRFAHYRHSALDNNSLASNQVQAIYEDREKNLWITTFPKGINFYDRSHGQVTNYTHRQGDPDSLSHSAVLDFMQTADGLLWVGTENGLNLFDLEQRRFVGRHLRTPGGLQANSVLSLLEDQSGDIWIGTWGGGLHRFDRVRQSFTHYAPERDKPGSISSAFIWDLYLDRDNRLWIATETGGLNRYIRETDSFEHFSFDQSNPHSISSNFVWAVLEDGRGRFWLATVDGLNLMDRGSGRFSRFTKQADNPKTIDSVRIRALMEDSAGRIWIGTQDVGAVVFDYTDETFTHLQWPDSLAPLVTSFVEDNQGFIWASTANGVGRIDPQTLSVRSFHRSHGLVGDNFNRDATFKDRKGRLYFGGTEGFSVFDPRAFTDGSEHSPLVLTEFRLFNRPVTIGEENSPLQGSITYTREMQLQHKHAMFSFAFAVLNHRLAAETRYFYKMDGFDADWHQVDGTNVATYTNLSPGRYKFQVRSADRDGNWNPHTAQVAVTVLPPPWRSVWAYGLYTLLVLLTAWFLVRMFLKHAELDKQRALNTELLRVNKIKDAFLVNTSHELRAPISSMIGLAETIVREERDRLPVKAEHRLGLIIAHGKRLSNLINEILDYGHFSERRIDVHPERLALRPLVESVLQQFRPIAQGKCLRLANDLDPAIAWVMADRNHIRQVFTNLIGNAVQYTEKGEVQISAQAEGPQLRIQVRDTGRGIAPEMRDRLFTPQVSKTLSEQALSGAGLGLAVTRHLIELHGGSIQFETRCQYPDQPGPSGTCFTFTLPLAEFQQLSGVVPSMSSGVTSAHPPAEPAAPTPVELLSGDLAPPPNAAALTLLIVDDDPVNRMVLGGILSLHHYRILEAGSGPEALDLVLRDGRHVDLVILDVMMPRMSGFEVCQRLRQRFTRDALPILFLTARHGGEDINAGLEVGGDEVLYKPVSKEVLLPRVRHYLQGRPPPRAVT
jgi:two-component system sensor histidine kinase ChiS